MGNKSAMVITISNILTPPNPSPTYKPSPLLQARSSFKTQVLDGGSTNVANNAQHWAVAEGDSAFNYCDLMVDWWPDEWTHPVGYHVTLPCKQAAHRAFDASWMALKVMRKIIHLLSQEN
jgi:hypothetical protein